VSSLMSCSGLNLSGYVVADNLTITLQSDNVTIAGSLTFFVGPFHHLTYFLGDGPNVLSCCDEIITPGRLNPHLSVLSNMNNHPNHATPSDKNLFTIFREINTLLAILFDGNKARHSANVCRSISSVQKLTPESDQGFALDLNGGGGCLGHD